MNTMTAFLVFAGVISIITLLVYCVPWIFPIYLYYSGYVIYNITVILCWLTPVPWMKMLYNRNNEKLVLRLLQLTKGEEDSLTISEWFTVLDREMSSLWFTPYHKNRIRNRILGWIEEINSQNKMYGIEIARIRIVEIRRLIDSDKFHLPQCEHNYWH